MSQGDYHHLFSTLLDTVSKSVKIQIAPNDLATLKQSKYKLCFAKKVGDHNYNVVWQAYDKFLSSNTFSWIPIYQLFGTNSFNSGVKVDVATNLVPIQLGETSTLDSNGNLQEAITGGPDTGFTLYNEYGSIHPGIRQLSTGINGERVSTPIYASTDPIVTGECLLTPVEKVLVWFEQDVITSTMFSTSRSKSIEIDLTETNSAVRLYSNGVWSTPK
ncbi:hypothetical protein EAE90_16525 [Photorhabdus caribbeanensis]|nr:hypothetical protein [Photorhabdus caribbeanensis]